MMIKAKVTGKSNISLFPLFCQKVINVLNANAVCWWFICFL